MANVRDYGAVGDGVTDDTAAVNAAIADLPADARSLYFPAGRYILPAGIHAIEGGAVRVYGDGMLASILSFTSGTCVTIQPLASQSTADYVQVDNLAIVGSSASAKTAFKLIACANGSIFSDLNITVLGNNADVGLAFEGWDQLTVQNVWIDASKNIVVSNVSVGLLTGTGQFDHVNFHDLSLFSPTNLFPLISIATSATNVTFTGRQCWVGGAGGLVIVGTPSIVHCRVENVRWEQSFAGASGYQFDLQPSAGANVEFINCDGGGPAMNGYRLRNLRSVLFESITFGNDHTGEVACDIDNTNDRITISNCRFINGAMSQRILGNQLEWQHATDLVNTAGTPFFANGYLAKRNAAGLLYESQIRYGVRTWAGEKPATEQLANGATLSIPAPAVTSIGQLRVTATDSISGTGTLHVAGIFSLAPLASAPIKSLVTTDIVTTSTAGKLSVEYAGGLNNPLVRNRTGVALTIVLIYN